MRTLIDAVHGSWTFLKFLKIPARHFLKQIKVVVMISLTEDTIYCVSLIILIEFGIYMQYILIKTLQTH